MFDGNRPNNFQLPVLPIVAISRAINMLIIIMIEHSYYFKSFSKSLFFPSIYAISEQRGPCV